MQHKFKSQNQYSGGFFTIKALSYFYTGPPVFYTPPVPFLTVRFQICIKKPFTILSKKDVQKEHPLAKFVIFIKKRHQSL